MTLIYCKEFKQSSADYAATEKGNTRQYTRTWLCISNDPADGPVRVIDYWSAQTGLVKGDIYETANEYDEGSFFKHLQVRRDADDGLNWLVTAEYGPWPFGGTSQNPLEQPAEIVWSFQQFEQIVDQDVYGNVICNSAGDPFQNPITIDQGRPILTITQNEPNFSAPTAAMYVDTVNAGSFMGCDERTVKCQNIGAARVYDQQYGYYWRVTYSFAFRPDKWDKVILDAGTRVKAGNNGQLEQTQNGGMVPITCRGAPVTQPALLDGNGGLGNQNNPQWQTFEVYAELPFNFNFSSSTFV
jgi:hypothetical protein